MVPTVLHVSDTLAFAPDSPDEPEVDLGGLANVVRRAIDRDVDAVVHTGNLLRSPEPKPDTIQAIRSALTTLRDAEIPVYLVAGTRESTGDGTAIEEFRDGDLAHELGTSPVRIDDLALYGVDHVDSGDAFQRELAALEPTEDYAYNVIACHQGIWPPLDEADADVSAFDAMVATDVFVDDVLAGGSDEPLAWENDDFDYCVTYAGSTNRRHREDGAIPTGTLIEASTDAHSHERIPLTATEPEQEIERLRTTLDHQPADLESADVETLADLYGLAARARELFDQRRREIREELLDRVHEDMRIQGTYAAVTRTTSQRRVTKPQREVFEALRQAGVNPYEVLELDSSALRELSEAGRVSDEDVFDREERTYVRVSDTEI
ncbi:metallophosphoesterase [Salinarchaeum sp. Harcht-Bsk1]|uniref:metallophosphoesterase family protein n=1 Tax=Salinarchaeum sp. Harcht-Bsk1 TaxID=1333523 RepID=UPI0003423095|nr:metallophosphoesterase [Salinarchaeum sp. Harcht-Bsk1]AGN00041.1 metallophosphoesterase [Salinarchaeum sp. Harcht-Bsk1]